MQYSLTSYIKTTMAQARFEKLEDGTFVGRIPKCKGVIAFGKTLRECRIELQSAMEDWIVLGLKMGHKLPVIDGINLNERPRRASVAAMQKA